MKTRRWIVAATKEAAECDVQMPWTRGARRAAFVAARDSAQDPCRASA
ncbi:hypothetical protein [Anianabacter salinae]|nr:hypothetical protein [Anianabacter salinae]MBV0912614.1 hypothetical protein [Anianabacter salinae]